MRQMHSDQQGRPARGRHAAGGPHNRGGRRLLVLALALGVICALTNGFAFAADDADKPAAEQAQEKADEASAQTADKAVDADAEDADLEALVAEDEAAAAANDDADAAAAADEAAAAAENNCTIAVPDFPLSARGLATPWILGGGCEQDNPDQGAFVEATILDPANGKMTIYRPLVVDARGPAVEPTVPRLPANAVVSINVGFQGDNLELRNNNGPGQTGIGIETGRCVNGLPGDIFGQVAFCNNFNNDGTGFFEVADELISQGKVKPPLPVLAADGRPCPTVWTYDITDQDPVDNTTTTYLVDDLGRTAQNIPANARNPVFAQVLSNGSDAALLAKHVNNALPLAADPAKHCTGFQATDITAGASSTKLDTTLALQSLEAPVAAVQPGAPTQGLLSAGGPFTTTDGELNLSKLNLYRLNVNQPPAATLEPDIEADATDEKFCRGLIGPNGLQKVVELDKQFYAGRASPDPAAADDLFNFVLFRFVDNSFGPGALDCENKIGVQIAEFLVLNTDDDGVVINAQVDVNGLHAASARANAGTLPVLPLQLDYVPGGQKTATPQQPTAPATRQPDPDNQQVAVKATGSAAQARPAVLQTGTTTAASAGGSGAATLAAEGQLPFTGTDSKLPLGAGAALVLTGGLLVLLSRRLRPGARRPRTRGPSPW